ncbi:hypothetical protein KY342_00900 [Candidatus Woesearchaeota archaeon]|nr:hypothetical protein [Candidatus Woesearchaeota archaeon]
MLSGKKLLKNVDLAIAKYPELFDALEEYDRTHRLRKINYKERANFTLDSNLLIRFRRYCQIHGMKMSTKIEQFIRKEIENP